MNIWIDHCDFYTDRDHILDYYDGLLDIKNQSRFITVSWSKFHDHQKSVLISSGDQETADSVIRITFHHNYFFDCDSRLPSIRFGKAHIFNNYYRDNGTAVNTRMGACVRVENNYFENTGTAVGMLFSPEPGAVQLTGNIFDNSGYSEEPVCELEVPYDYSDILHPAEQIPDTVSIGTGEGIPENLDRDFTTTPHLRVFPNPATGRITLTGEGAEAVQEVLITDVAGRSAGPFRVESNHEIDLSGLGPGIYFVYMKKALVVRKIVLY
jgi:pectate lyase